MLHCNMSTPQYRRVMAGTLRPRHGAVNRHFALQHELVLAVQQPYRYGPSVATVLIKKYGNRRLYDTGESRYITLDELATKIRAGADLRIVDAQTNDDLTQ